MGVKTVRYPLLRAKARELLKKLPIDKPPVPVEALAALIGLEVRFEPYADGDLSGMCFRKPDGTGIIGVNSAHSVERRRFTIAHEIGHFLLHSDEEIHVDERIPLNPIGLRYGSTSSSTNPKEIEANAFAADLLMPVDLLRTATLPSDFGADEEIASLADQFEVSLQAMTIRLTTLKLPWTPLQGQTTPRRAD